MTYDVIKYTDDMQEFTVLFSTHDEQLADDAYDLFSTRYAHAYVDVIERFN